MTHAELTALASAALAAGQPRERVRWLLAAQSDAATADAVLAGLAAASAQAAAESSGDLQVPARPSATPPKPPQRGPGTELHTLLASLGITPKYGCNCANLAAEMDRNGPAWCLANIGAIAEKLRANAATVGWVEKLAVGVKAIASGVAFRLDPTRLYESLIEEAVRRTREATP